MPMGNGEWQGFCKKESGRLESGQLKRRQRDSSFRPDQNKFFLKAGDKMRAGGLKEQNLLQIRTFQKLPKHTWSRSEYNGRSQFCWGKLCGNQDIKNELASL